jgi:hypothetical protein
MVGKQEFDTPQDLFANTTTKDLRELIAAGHSGADLRQADLIKQAMIEVRRREWWRTWTSPLGTRARRETETPT